jgi:hypothetical protein
LAGCDFKIVYRPENKNGKPDALNRHSKYYPTRGGMAKDIETQPIMTVLPPENFGHYNLQYNDNRVPIISVARLQEIPNFRFHQAFIEIIVVSGSDDLSYQEKLDQTHSRDTSPHYIYNYGVLYFNDQLWIPDDNELKKEVLELEHDSKIGGHMSQVKTLEIIHKNIFYPKMKEEINNCVRWCLVCQRMKHPRHARYSLLHALELAYAP